MNEFLVYMDHIEFTRMLCYTMNRQHFCGNKHSRITLDISLLGNGLYDRFRHSIYVTQDGNAADARAQISRIILRINGWCFQLSLEY